MTDAASESPDLVIDAATLTGAARTALGPEVPAVFSSCNGIDPMVIPGVQYCFLMDFGYYGDF